MEPKLFDILDQLIQKRGELRFYRGISSEVVNYLEVGVRAWEQNTDMEIGKRNLWYLVHQLKSDSHLGFYGACWGGNCKLALFLVPSCEHSTGVELSCVCFNDGQQSCEYAMGLGLFYACLGGHTELVELLLRNLDYSDSLTIARAFHATCIGGHRKLAELLIRETNLNSEFAWDYGLYHACKEGHMDLVELTIHPKGPNNPQGARNWTLGLEEATAGNHKEVIDFLTQKMQ